ncbi:hypothetical protein D3C76_1623440 [compost metagenome]
MAIRVTAKTRICMYDKMISVDSVDPNENEPGIKLGIDLSFESWDSRTVFCKKIDMPIAEMRGINRLLLRRGL